jgi:protein O-mannosyl-transferase
LIDRSENPSKSGSDRYALPALIVLTLIAMGPVLRNEFVAWDDYNTIATNPRMNPPTLENVAHYWRNAHMLLYVPVTYTAWSALASIAQTSQRDALGATLNPWVFHGASLLVHVATAVLVMALLKHLGCGAWPAALAAMAFAVHPVQVETVAWASGLKDLLGGMFTVATLLCYVRAVRMRDHDTGAPLVVDASEVENRAQGQDAGVTNGRCWYLAAAACYVLGMLSKPTAIVAPLLAGTIDWLILRRPFRSVVAAAAPLLILAIPCAVWTRTAQPTNSGNQPVVPLLARPLVAGDAVAFYVGKLVAPVRLSIHYVRRPDEVWRDGRALWTWLVPAVVVLVAIALRRRAPWGLAAAMLFVLGLLPVLGLVPFEFQYYSTVADHYLYLPMLGIAVLVGFALNARQQRWPVLVISLALMGWTVLSHRQARVWRDTNSLMSHVVDVNDRSWVGVAQLGKQALMRGDSQTGVQMLQRACELRPDDPSLMNDLGTAFDRAGRTEEAEAQYRFTIRVAPFLSDPWSNLGALLAEQGKLDEAIHCFEQALWRNRDNHAAQVGLQRALSERAATRPSG